MDEFKKDLEDYFCRFTFGQFVTLILLEIVTLFFVFYLGAHYGPDLIGSRSDKKENLLPKDSSKSIDEIVGTPPVDYTYPEVLTGSPHQDDSKGIRVKPSGVTAEDYERQGPAPSAKAETQTPKGKFAIQVGSYQSAEEASDALERWKGKGYKTFLSVGEVPNKGTWYRVRIGDFSTRNAAEQYMEDFKSKENIPALVVLSKS